MNRFHFNIILTCVSCICFILAHPHSLSSSTERRPFSDGSFLTAAGADHVDQCKCVWWGRLLLPALHRWHTPPGGDAVGGGAPGGAYRGGEDGGSGGWRGGTHMLVPTEQTTGHPALGSGPPRDPWWVSFKCDKVISDSMQPHLYTIHALTNMKKAYKHIYEHKRVHFYKKSLTCVHICSVSLSDSLSSW